MATSLAELSADELSTLSVYEVVIRQGLESFVEVGNALARIRDARLYRAEFATFEDYCQTRWSLGRSYVNRIVAAAEVAGDLVTMGTKPETERQARPLASVPKEERAEVWQRVVETAPVDAKTSKPKITAAHVAKVVEQSKKTVDTSPKGECIAGGRHEWGVDRDGEEYCKKCCEDRPVEKKPAKVEPEGIIGKFMRLVWMDATTSERAILMTWFREMDKQDAT